MGKYSQYRVLNVCLSFSVLTNTLCRSCLFLYPESYRFLAFFPLYLAGYDRTPIASVRVEPLHPLQRSER